MSKKKHLQIVIYDVHPQIALLRDLSGYVDSFSVPEELDIYDNDADDVYLKSLDPINWRENDHYTVLGLSKLRHRATDEDIKKAYRSRILHHHPDKRRHRGENIQDISHDYFACITQAYEILGNPSKRFAYDCVDKRVVDDSLPSIEDVKRDFFGVLREAFRRNTRWSKHQPLPDLGYSSTPIDYVHRFYEIWEKYETIRDYSYLDEEEKNKGEDRDHRRYIDKMNKAERAKRRAAEVKRIRTLVEMARSYDPRLKAEQERIKAERNAKKAARIELNRKIQEEQLKKKRLEEEIFNEERRKIDNENYLQAEKLKKERDAEKTIHKEQKKRLKTNVFDRFDYFNTDKLSKDSHEYTDLKINITHEVDVLCHSLSGVHLKDFNEKLEKSLSVQDANSIFQQKAALSRKISSNNSEMSVKINGEAEITSKPSCKWFFEATQTLVKAINIFPAGTNKRWEVIAEYLNQQLKGNFSSREVLKYAKSLTSDDTCVKLETNIKAFDNFTKDVKKSAAFATDHQNISITTDIESEAIRPWTAEEQKLLEGSLRTVTAVNLQPGEERWQKIADIVGTRTRKECMLRYKSLAEQIKAKRAAISAAESKSKR